LTPSAAEPSLAASAVRATAIEGIRRIWVTRARARFTAAS
jgi:hypothetical protein